MKEEKLNTELHDRFFIAIAITATKEKEAQSTVRCAFVSMKKIRVQVEIKRRPAVDWSKRNNSRRKR